MMRLIGMAAGVAAVGLLSASAFAVPVLQVGAPDGMGGYADYLGDAAPPPGDVESATTSGNLVYAAGTFQKFNKLPDPMDPVPPAVQPQYQTHKLGGGVDGIYDYSDFLKDLDSNPAMANLFDAQDGAILVVSVPSLAEATAFKISLDGGLTYFDPFATSMTAIYPNGHFPVQDDAADFLFFNIGNFTKAEYVPNFDESSGDMGLFPGQIKDVTITGMGSMDWIHFDLLAIQTDVRFKVAAITVNGVDPLQYDGSGAFNPPSHDLTWHPPRNGVPEPSTLILLGTGFLGLGLLRRRDNL